MLYQMTVMVEVHDEEMAAHDGDAAPPPNDVREWYGGDLARALDLGLVTLEHDQLEVEVANG